MANMKCSVGILNYNQFNQQYNIHYCRVLHVESLGSFLLQLCLKTQMILIIQTEMNYEIVYNLLEVIHL